MDLSLLFPVLILLLFIPIFLSTRKQKRQMAEMAQLQASLADGDVVMTTSGLRGTVVDASYEDTIDLEIADGVVTTWVRGAIREKVEEKAEDAAAAPVDGADAPTVEPTVTSPAPAVDGAPVAASEAPSLEKKSDPATS